MPRAPRVLGVGAPVRRRARHGDRCERDTRAAGSTLTIDAYDMNIGHGLSGASTAGIYLSTDATITRPMLNGRPWTRVDLVQGRAVDRTTCRYGADGPLQIWANAAENDYYAFAPGTAGSVLMTDVDGDLVVVITAIGDTASATDRAALESIIASMKIDPA